MRKIRYTASGDWIDSHKDLIGRNGYIWMKGSLDPIELISENLLPMTLIVGESSHIRYVAPKRLADVRIYVRAKSCVSLYMTGCSSLHIVLGRDSQLDIVDRSVSKKQTIHAVLAQPGARISFTGLAHIGSHALCINILHQAAATSSYVKMKGVIENASGSTESMVTINGRQSVSQQSIAYVTCGTSAKTAYRPEFAFHTDEVIATHGASIGQIDEEVLLYLQSRGMPREVAIQTYLQGFCEEVLALWPKGDDV